MGKISVLITGGNGDIAKSIAEEIHKNMDAVIDSPGRGDLDICLDENIVKWGQNKIDVLINCAGVINPSRVTDKEYIETIELHNQINFIGPQKLIYYVLQNNPNAIIINIGSTAGKKSRANWSSYCASKAALIMLTKCLAEDGVKAVCISPGRTDTKMRDALFPGEEKGLLLKPIDIANKVLEAIKEELPWGENIEVVYGS